MNSRTSPRNGKTSDLWKKISNKFPLKKLSEITLDSANGQSLIPSEDKYHMFDSGTPKHTHTKRVDMIRFESNSIVLTEFKNGANIDKIDIYRKALESILVEVKYLSGDSKFNPFDYLFKFELIFNEPQAISPGSKRYRLRESAPLYGDYLKPLRNHIFDDVVAVPATIFSPAKKQ